MPRKTDETTINGVSYKVTQFGALKADEVMARMGMGVATRELKPEDMLWARWELAGCTKVGIVDTKGDGKTRFVDLQSIYDDHFAGGPEAQKAKAKWLQFAVEVNFGPFVDVVRAVVRALPDLLRSSSPPASTGDSGDSSQATA